MAKTKPEENGSLSKLTHSQVKKKKRTHNFRKIRKQTEQRKLKQKSQTSLKQFILKHLHKQLVGNLSKTKLHDLSLSIRIIYCQNMFNQNETSDGAFTMKLVMAMKF